MSAEPLAGFLSGAALIVAIGAQNAFVLRQGLRREHVLPVVALCAAADAVLIAAGVAGLGALLRVAPATVEVARYGGALFLIAYGAAAAQRAMRPERLTVDTTSGVSLGSALAICLAFTFLNPHVYLDTVVLLGTLANRHDEVGRWRFGAGAATASFVWFFLLGYGARALAPVFRRPAAWRVLDLAIAFTMFGLAAGLLAG